MIKKYFVAVSIAAAILLLFIATTVYPGGSRFDKNSIGFDWTKNYISNLFGTKAVNGADNPARVWAGLGMLFMAIGFGVFYYDFSKRIASRNGQNIIKYAGICSASIGFFVITPYHDTMVTIADVFSMVSTFYITMFVSKTKLTFHKVLCWLCLLSLYFVTYIYYSNSFPHFLPVMQKINFAISIIWMLSLQYFSTADDFKVGENKMQQ